MSRQSGGGYMGSHKHGVHGRTRQNPINARRRAMDTNRDGDERARLRHGQRSQMFDTIRALFRSARRGA